MISISLIRKDEEELFWSFQASLTFQITIFKISAVFFQKWKFHKLS